MNIQQAALLDSENVVNVVVVDLDLPPGEQFIPPPGLTLELVTVATGPAYIRGTFDGTVFIPPPPEPESV